MTLQPRFLPFIKCFLSLPPVCTQSSFSNCIIITKIGNRQIYISSRKIAKIKERNKRKYWNQLALRCVVWHLELSAPPGGIARNGDPCFFLFSPAHCHMKSCVFGRVIFRIFWFLELERFTGCKIIGVLKITRRKIVLKVSRLPSYRTEDSSD